ERAAPWKESIEAGEICGCRVGTRRWIGIAGFIACANDYIAIARGQHIAVAAYDALRRREWRCGVLRKLAAELLQVRGAEVGEPRGVVGVGENDDCRLGDCASVCIERLP